ncbi:hypothetical protein NQ176_g11377 [Zarea fungicola]|uniref:Uncharacterized protein n=1 Tax=Zarea fungicola TaxID=93591 RepID=A0ACC1MBN0_9HYPO|nr:hypothetical protein NQ176_g11377 [Lecanicillium fungicola]
MRHQSIQSRVLRDVPLRRVNIWTFGPAFILNLLHGITTGCVFPALSLVPLAMSAVQCAFLEHPSLRPTGLGSSSILLTPRNIFITDALLSGSLFFCLLGSWINMSVMAYPGVGGVILGSYCTIFIMSSYAIHTVYGTLHIMHALSSHMCGCADCLARQRQEADAAQPLTEQETPEEQV